MTVWSSTTGSASIAREGLLISIVLAGDIEEAHWSAVLTTYSDMLIAQRAVVIADALAVTTFPSTHRKVMTKWRHEQLRLLQRRCLGVAYVIGSPVIRGLLNTTFWVKRPAWPYIVTAELRQAERWGREKTRLAEASDPPQMSL